ncbi:putative tellurium resistance membrane protein TerC [Hasllibacter halocynthiae]|uniref:Putative tellurium resistance membrane protein TerC n=1 Tax=Hasllibacter halocynthiae TaxID=595589 RepID=A0A2T0X789_9RHOB|nr:TerC family protein [Hasllibacter halocynthiae]PRY94812.1 putative tellurium resistance membrane protein TerC [Hasllibacter halocynthiae]
MIGLLSDPAVWASFLTLTILEIVLGVDNVIFLSIAVGRLPREQQRSARIIGLSGALVLRILLLFSITWIVSLSRPFAAPFGFELSWRDVVLIAGGLFLIYKAATEIFDEVETGGVETVRKEAVKAAFAGVVVQVMVLDLVFSLDSVITAVGIADHVEVMIAAVTVAIGVMMVAAGPIARFVETHPSTKMLALAFLVMVGMALVADGFHYHVERGFIYAAMAFAGGVEALNLWRARRARRAAAAEG